VRAGEVEEVLISPVDRFALLQLHVPRGAREVSVSGVHLGAQVTDLVLGAR
jgi:hypothetical protein